MKKLILFFGLMFPLLAHSQTYGSFKPYGGLDGSTNINSSIDNQSIRTLTDYFTDVANVRDFGAVCDGTTDDTTAFQNAINYATSKSGVAVYVPPTLKCAISTGLTATLVNGSLHFYSNGKHGATLLFPSSFTGVGLNITMAGTSTPGVAASIEGITFLKNTGTTMGGTALEVTENSDVVDPSLMIAHLHFSGEWSVGEQLNNVNVDYNQDSTCMSFDGICVNYDSSGPISVEHHIKDLYANMGSDGIGLSIGHSGMTASLQGFTIDGISCTGGTTCISAIGAVHAIDQLTVYGGQINSTNGITTNGVDTINIFGNYFLGNTIPVSLQNGLRSSISNNNFFMTGSGSAILFDNMNSSSVGGGSIIGNSFTGTVNGTAIKLTEGTNYTYISDNNCFELKVCVETTTLSSGYPGNTIGINSMGVTNGGFQSTISNLTFYNSSYAHSESISASGSRTLTIGASGDTYKLNLNVDGAGNSTFDIGLGTIFLKPNAEVSGILNVDSTLNVNGVANFKSSISGTSATYTGNMTSSDLITTDSTTPTSTTACVQGSMHSDDNYLYICTSALTYKKVALGSL